MKLFPATGILILSFFLLTSVQTKANLNARLSENSLMDFGHQLEKSLNSQNPYYFNISFDTERLLLHVFEKYGQSPDASFHKGFIDGIKNNLDLGNLLVNDLNTGSTIALISVRSGQTPSLIFRLIGLYGINYHEYFVEDVNGTLKITDAYIYSSGQRISESVGDLYISSWFNIETEYTETLQKINDLRAEGKYKQAFHKWEKLSQNAKTDKSNLLLALELAAKVDKDAFYEVYNLFSLYYPSEPGKYLIPLDGLIASGLYERALENIDSLEIIVKNDPILNFVRANVFYEANRIEKAELCLSKLIENMPEFEMGYFSLLDIYLQEDRYENATLLLDQMIGTFQNYKEDYTPLFANYPDFINSPEYQSWLKY